MRIAVGSIFRDSASYLDRYAQQLDALKRSALTHSFRPVLVEGDSTDDTKALLEARFNGCVTERSHGGPVFGSVDNPQRWRQISFACNGVLERIEPDDDALIYVESDLLWEPETMLALLHYLEWNLVDAVAPMCKKDGLVYDVWGMRAQGENFRTYFPFHPMLLAGSSSGLYELDSAGSCIVMRGEVARTARFDPADQGIVGFCLNLRKQGYRLWLDPKLAVKHP